MSSKDYIYCYQGSALRVGSGNVVVGKVFDPYDPSTVPPNTIRCKFSPGYTPTMGNSQTLIVKSENIWDIFGGGSRLFLNNNDLLEVLVGRSGRSSLWYYFDGCSYLTSINLMDTESCTDMTGLFRGCVRLSNVTISTTRSVGNMERMFQSCSSLVNPPLLDTSSCGNMSEMFRSCSSLSYVPLLDTSSCGNMNWSFEGCVNVLSGALALYQQVSTQATPPSSHFSTFSSCGRDTVTGAAELAQIPTSWGGTMD